MARARRPGAEFTWCIAALAVVAAVLAWYRIGRDSFWLDEAEGLRFVRETGWTHLLTVDNGNNALYYALLKLWLPVGKSETTIRFLSLVPFVLTVPAAAYLARRIRGERVAILVGAIVASHPMLVRYGQEARAMSLVTFLVTAAVLTLTVGLQDSRAGVFVAGVVLLALAAYAHPIAAFTGVSILAWVCLRSRDALPIKRLWLASIFAIVIAPLAIVVVRAGSNQIGWTGRGSNGGLVSLLSVIWENASDTPAGVILGLFAVAGCVVTVRSSLRHRRPVDAVVEGLPFVWIVGTGVLVLVASLHQSLLVPRYLLLVVPAFAILAAEGACAIGVRRIAVPILVAAVIVNFGFVVERGAHYRPENWRQAEKFIAGHADAGDGIVFAPSFKAVSFEYYQVTRHKVWPEPIFPTGSWGTVDIPFGQPIHDTPADIARRSNAIAHHSRNWLVIAPGPGGGATPAFIRSAERALRSRGRQVATWQFGDIRVLLYA